MKSMIERKKQMHKQGSFKGIQPQECKTFEVRADL